MEYLRMIDPAQINRVAIPATRGEIFFAEQKAGREHHASLPIATVAVSTENRVAELPSFEDLALARHRAELDIIQGRAFQPQAAEALPIGVATAAKSDTLRDFRFANARSSGELALQPHAAVALTRPLVAQPRPQLDFIRTEIKAGNASSRR